MSNIIIGCANFGMQYGLKNNKLTNADIQDIAKEAVLNNIRSLDTAVDYHGSHKAIDLCPLFNNFNITTKIRSSNVAALNENSLFEQINTGFSLGRVRTVLLHDEEFYKNKDGQAVFKKLKILKKNGFLDKIGVSVYGFKHAKYICDNFEIDLLQIPFNPFNQQFTHSNIRELRINNTSLDLHARSAFLQGVLVSNAKNKIRHQYQKIFKKWDNFLNSQGVTGFQYCMNYVKNDLVNNNIFGVRTRTQLKGLIEEEKIQQKIFKIFECEIPEKLYDPRLWQQ